MGVCVGVGVFGFCGPVK